MTPTRRASERAGVGPRRQRPRPLWAFAIGTVGALAACRQTVVLDPNAPSDAATGGGGGAGGRETGPEPDAADGDGASGGAGGGNRSDGGRLDGAAFCLNGQIQPLLITMRTPDVVFTVDRSSGMTSWFGTGSRLQIIQGQVDALVAKYQKVVRFGYQEFPAATGAGIGAGTCSNGQGCCAGAVVAPTSNALRRIDDVLMACDGTSGMSGGNGTSCAPQAARPTADALTKCDQMFATLPAFPDAGDRYDILLTGGDPSCMGSDPTSTPCGDAVAAATKLNRDSIGTAVFGVGDEAVGSMCLDQLALAGGLDSGGASPLYHLARTPTDLDTALSAVIETMAEEACQIDVRQPPADPTKVALLFDGVAVAQDGVDGWDFDMGSNVKITIHGAACDTYLQKAPHVDLVSGCTPPHH
jgi:hypothetical protein